MRRRLWLLTAVAWVVLVGGAGAATTGLDENGTVLLGGGKVFPIVLAKGPPLDGTTPSGASAVGEVVGAGVNFFKVGPATTAWTAADIADAKAWDEALAGSGAYTWINLATVSQATPGSATDSVLEQVVTALTGDAAGRAGIGMWRGADEPYRTGIAPSSLRLAYCRSTGRDDRDGCAGEPVLDQDHLWVTVQAPKGTATSLSPYSAVTDVQGDDEYPIVFGDSSPDLHQVGMWTSTIGAATPNHAVWSSLQVCSSGSVDGSGNYVLPTLLQERYMVYDAIINGARDLAFYGGNNPSCWSPSDSAYGWNWTFWASVLKPLIREINASSPIAPALVSPGSTQVLSSSDSSTEVISRQGAASGDLWVIAARSGAGSEPVTISGLPAGITSGSVYTENRSVTVANGSFTDTFGQWGVHVYHFVLPPSLDSFTPANGPPGTSVTIAGTHLAGATAVAFGGVAATYTVASDTQITATVPAGAASGPITVTTPGGTVATSATFTVTPANLTPPTIDGTATVGSVLTGDDGTWSGSPAPTLTQQWRRCDAGGAACADISGAVATTYSPVQADLGAAIRLRVTATSAGTTTTVDSAPTGAVTAQALPSPAPTPTPAPAATPEPAPAPTPAPSPAPSAPAAPPSPGTTPAPAATAQPPPAPAQTSPTLAAPLLRPLSTRQPQGVHLGSAESVAARFSTNEPLRLTMTVVRSGGAKAIRLLLGTRLAGAVAGSGRSTVSATVTHAGIYSLVARLLHQQLIPRSTYLIRLTATNTAGTVARLAIPFRA
jgi:hypothetical protein